MRRAATITRSMSGPRTITSAWRRSSATFPASRSTTFGATGWTSTRSTATRLIYLTGHAEPRPAPNRNDRCSRSIPAARAVEIDRRPKPTTRSSGLATWLTRSNRQFSRNLANRVWFHLLGRGIVEPVDDFRDSNPPSNPALLDALTALSSTMGCGSSRWLPRS